jgi:hypothetical protein
MAAIVIEWDKLNYPGISGIGDIGKSKLADWDAQLSGGEKGVVGYGQSRCGGPTHVP